MTEKQEHIGDRVLKRRKALELTLEDVAAACDVSYQAIQKLEKGGVRRPKYLYELSKILQAKQDWLLYGDQDQSLAGSEGGYHYPAGKSGGAGDTGYQAQRRLPDAPDTEEDNTGVDDFIFGTGLKVPVYGTVLGDNAETAVINEGNITEYVPAHPNQRNLPGAFALRVSGDSMEPRYKEGELVYVHPRRPPGKGDDVVIDYKSGNAAVKSYLGQTQTTLRLRQYNPVKDIEILKKEINGLYTVIGRG